jgi:hypothetical protein
MDYGKDAMDVKAWFIINRWRRNKMSALSVITTSGCPPESA